MRSRILMEEELTHGVFKRSVFDCSYSYFYRGFHTKAPLYKRLGQVEVEDQIETTKALLKKYTRLSASKTAIWGWVSAI